MLVPAIQTIGAIAVAILAIGFCLFLLLGLRKCDDTDVQLGELLVHEIIAEQPRLLPARGVPELSGPDAKRFTSNALPLGADDDGVGDPPQ